MNAKRKRSNNSQIELLVEKLHENRELAQGNWGEEINKVQWRSLAVELNLYGCARSVEEWQHRPNLPVPSAEQGMSRPTSPARIRASPINGAMASLEELPSVVLSAITPEGLAPLLTGTPERPEQTELPRRLVNRPTPHTRRPSRPTRAQRLDPGPITAAMSGNGRLLAEGMSGIADAIRDAAREVASAIRDAAQIMNASHP